MTTSFLLVGMLIFGLQPFGVAGMVVSAMILQLAFGVEVFLTLVTGILKHSRKVLAFHMPFDVSLIPT